MNPKHIKTCAVLFLAALALLSLCVEKKTVGAAEAKCVATGGSWTYSECSNGCVPDTKQERLDRIKNPVACDASCHKDYVCSCPSGRYWASREEGCILNQAQSCAQEGGVISTEGACCGKLQKLALMKNLDGGCKVTQQGFVCADCGNGVCGPGENECNCPQDCTQNIVGGQCSYKEFPGKCTIENPASSDGVNYVFMPSGSVDISGTFLTSANQINPYTGFTTSRPSQVIEIGRSYDCTLKVETRGTCTPIIAEFTPINCGNGICDITETVANCPKDCKGPGAITQNKCAVDADCVSDGFRHCYNKVWLEIATKNAPRLPVAICTGACILPCKCLNSVCVLASCGNGTCDLGETEANCPQDCNKSGAVCGNGFCEEGETASSCPQDCQPHKPICGDKFCERSMGEDERTCPQDCVIMPSCGNSMCEEGENVDTCPQDCKQPRAVCGNSFCEVGENEATCPQDCLIKAVCGNGFCEQGELGHCPEDCGSTTSICGNGICESGEDHNNCPRDCYPVVDRKPVIYLYPQKPETVNVKIELEGKLIADYPDYDPAKGWEVMAYPDGRLVNLADGREYSYLFWEGDSYGNDFDMSQGFVVKGSDTAQFLQDTLAKIGLTPREYNEFIVYWYPRMKDNPYNIVHFAGTEYTSKAKLTITPQPDSLLRVFMVYEPSQTNVSVTAQTFKPFEGKGFTVVEWGGSVIG